MGVQKKKKKNQRGGGGGGCASGGEWGKAKKHSVLRLHRQRHVAPTGTVGSGARPYFWGRGGKLWEKHWSVNAKWPFHCIGSIKL